MMNVLIIAVALTATSAEPEWITPEQSVSRHFTTAAFLKRQVNDRPISNAVWKTTAGGVYEAYVNGEAVGGGFLKPGFTSVWKTRQETECDVTRLLNRSAGATNVFCALVTEGWWRDSIVRGAGGPPIFRGRLEVTYSDGTSEVFGTRAGEWLAAYGSPVVRANIYDGEFYDARHDDGWMRSGSANPADWRPAKKDERFRGVVRAMAGGRVYLRRDIRLAPVAAKFPMTIKSGETAVFDFGQNCAAIPEFTAHAKRDVTISILTAEMLNDTGAKERGNDGPAGTLYRANLRGAKSRVDYVFADGQRVTFHPTFSFMGYRYASVTATGGDLVLLGLTSIPVTSIAQEDEIPLPEFKDPAVARFATNVLWGMRSNYLSVPTDCPQRDERLGWTGDTQVFAPTAFRLAKVGPFLRKWLGDLRDEQGEDGSYPSVAPAGRFGGDRQSIGWADAGVIVPYTIWKETGDLTSVREHWVSAKRFMSLLRKTEYRTPPHGYQFADWLSLEDLGSWETNWGRNWHGRKGDYWFYWDFLGGCYWLQDAQMMEELSRALRKNSDAAQFAADARRAKAYLKKTFVMPDGRLDPRIRNLQTAALFALKFKVVEGKGAAATRDELAKSIRANGSRLKTGFLGTSIALETLTAAGLNDLALEIACGHGFPGWLYSVDQGATTIWERWNSYTKDKGFGDVSMNSFNHYAYGSALGWFLDHVPTKGGERK